MKAQVSMYRGKSGGGEGHARWAVYMPKSATWVFPAKAGKREAAKLAAAMNSCTDS